MILPYNIQVLYIRLHLQSKSPSQRSSLNKQHGALMKCSDKNHRKNTQVIFNVMARALLFCLPGNADTSHFPCWGDGNKIMNFEFLYSHYLDR